MKRKLFLLFVILLMWGMQKQVFLDKDTLYNRVWIYKTIHPESKKEIQMMQINDEYSSAMFLHSDDLVFPYTKYYRLDAYFVPEIKTALMIGGAGYSYPKEFIRKHTNAHMDVVEIDPEVTQLAKRYFGLKESAQLAIYHEDARTFLNTSQKKYDVIYGDAFRSKAPPYNLATKEVIQKYYDVLSENGVLLINVIGSLEGSKSKFLKAEYATIKTIFPQVYIFPVHTVNDPFMVQNILLVVLKKKEIPQFVSKNPELQQYLARRWEKPFAENIPLLTDDFCPTEQYSLGLVF